MTKCQGCGATCQLYLCNVCIDGLADMLCGLARREIPSDPPRFGPGWIALLEDAIVSDIRLGDAARRTGKRIDHLDGDATLASCIGLLPEDETDLTKARERRYYANRNRLLAAGRVNERANLQLKKLVTTLGTWVSRLGGPDHMPPTYAAYWLCQRVDDIASNPFAGQCPTRIRRHITAIEHTINRPPPDRFCGPCPDCGTELRAPLDRDSVVCPECEVAFDIDELQTQLWDRLQDRLVTYPELTEICRRTAEPVPVRSTLYKWIKQGRLAVKGYQRPDGHRRIAPRKRSERDQPVYRLGDVRQLMAEKPARRKARA